MKVTKKKKKEADVARVAHVPAQDLVVLHSSTPFSGCVRCFALRLKDLLGPVTRVKKKKKGPCGRGSRVAAHESTLVGVSAGVISDLIPSDCQVQLSGIPRMYESHYT